MKKELLNLLILFSLTLTSVGAWGAVTCTVSSDKTTLTVSGTGEMSDYSSTGGPGYSNRTTITKVVIEEGVTKIGKYAFSGLGKVTEINIPSSVLKIEQYAFQNCSTVTTINFGSTSTKKCNVDTIGSDAFYGLKAGTLTKVVCWGGAAQWLKIKFGNNRANPINYAKGLYSATNSKITSLSTSTGVTRVNPYAFYNDTLLTSITLGADVASVGTYAFYSCSNVKTLTINTGLKRSELSAFSGLNKAKVQYNGPVKDWLSIEFPSYLGNPTYSAKNLWTKENGSTTYALLRDLVLPASPTTIPANAFYNDTAIHSIVFPTAVTTIGANAFSGCKNVEYIVAKRTTAAPAAETSSFNNVTKTIPVYVTTFTVADKYTSATGWSSFTNYKYDASAAIGGNCGADGGDNLTWSLTLADGKLVISGEGEMEDYDNASNKAPWSAYANVITSVSIASGSTPTKIGSYAFYGLSQWTYGMILPGSVEEVGAYAFGKCGLSSLQFGRTTSDKSSIKKIGNQVCSVCTNITKVIFYGDIENWVNVEFPFSGANPIYVAKHFYLNSSSTEMTTLNLPEGVTEIKQNAFYNCESLTKVIFPSTLTQIASSAFSGCKNVTEIESLVSGRVPAANGTFFYSMASSVPVGMKVVVMSAADVTAYNAATDGWRVFKDKFVTPSGDCGTGLTWTLNGETGILKISGSGTIQDYNRYGAPWYAYKDYITDVVFSTGVTGIGKYAFADCDKITTLHFPFYVSTGATYSGLATIGTYAFLNCTSLANIAEVKDDTGTAVGTNFKLPAKLTTISQAAFDNCNITGDLTLQNAVTTVGAWAFRGNENISSVTLSSKLTSLGLDAFGGDVNMESVTFSGTLKAWLGIAFSSDKANPVYYAKTLKIGSAVLTDCVVPEDVTEVKNYAFVNDEALETINLHAGVTRIGTKAFNGCTHIKHIVAKRVTPCSAASGVFDGINAGIPVYVQSVAVAGVYAAAHSETITAGWRSDFNYQDAYPAGACGENLNWVYDVMGQTLTISGSGAMYDWPNALDRQWREYAADVKTIVWADGCAPTSIGENAFKDFTNLTCSISIPETVTKIGANAYTGCKNTGTTLNIPAAVQEIGAEAFKNHKEIGTIYFGDNEHDSQLQTVGADAFRDMANNAGGLRSVYYYGTMADWANIDFANFYSTPMQNWSESHPVSFFFNGAKLTSISIEPGTTVIKPQVFFNMKDVTGAVTIPSTVTSIGERAFNGTAITSVTIGDEEHGSELTSIGSFAFGSVKTLTDVTVYAMTAPTNASTSNFDSKAFNEATLRVHAMAKKSYANETTWKQFKNVVTFGKMELALSDNADNSAVLAEYHGETVDVQLTRSLVNGTYNTICLPFALDADQIETAFGEGTDIEKLTDSSVSGEEFTVGFAKSDVMEAGVPYLIKPTAAQANPSFEDVVIDKDVHSVNTAHVEFNGLTSKTYLEANRNLLFVGANNTLYYPDASGDMKGMRAYFILKSSVPAGARGRIVMHENTSTGVDNANDDANVDGVKKVLRNGQVVILRGEAEYNVMGERL